MERIEGRKYVGGCHCGAVRFEVELEASVRPSRCNCSICTKLAPTGALVKPAAFRVVTKEEDLGAYAWGTSARRHFCKVCGVYCFGRGHLDVLGGDFVSVNLNTVEGLDPNALEVVYWDGRHDNWQAGPRPAPWPIES